MKISLISIKELRENFPAIRKGLENKRVYILIYRSKPLAKLLPFDFKEKPLQEQKSAKQLVQDLAGGLKLGRDLTPDKINKILEERYGK